MLSPLTGDTEAAQAVRSTCFWNCLLLIPMVGFLLVGWIGGGAAALSVLLPPALAIAALFCVCFTLHGSGALSEASASADPKPGDLPRSSTGSMSDSVQRVISIGQAVAQTSSGPRNSDPGPVTVGARSLWQDTLADPARNPTTDSNRRASDSAPYGVAGGFGRPLAGAAGDGRWEVEMDRDKWVPFDEAEQRLFATARANGLPSVEFSGRGFRYALDFTKMVQRNVATGKERPVRFMPADGGSMTPPPPSSPPEPMPGGEAWQVQMETGGWIDFEGEALFAIQQARANSEPVASFHIRGQHYQVRFDEGVQRNLKTSKQRAVRPKPEIVNLDAGSGMHHI